MGKAVPSLALLLLSLLLSAALVSAQTETGSSSSAPAAAVDTQPQPAEAADDPIFTEEYWKKAEELYAQALTDYFTAHPDRLEAELSQLTSPEYDSIPSTFLDSFHIDRAAIETKIHENDERLVNEMEAEMEMADSVAEAEVRVDDEAEVNAGPEVESESEEDESASDYQISQRGGGGGTGTGLGRGRRFGRTFGPRFPSRRRCVYYRGRRRCPPFIMVPSDYMDDMDDDYPDGPIMILPLRSRRMWIILMRRRYGPFWFMRGRGRGRGRGLGRGMGMGRGRGMGLGRGRGMRMGEGRGRGRGLGAGRMRGGGGSGERG